jgi:hypothetical protein
MINKINMENASRIDRAVGVDSVAEMKPLAETVDQGSGPLDVVDQGSGPEEML